INFVVVTKGAGRVAEVSARFTLDAMPGKQMAVDADLSSGMITSDQARIRRKNLEREADFYGAMDGASKFVHGDAIAGLLITAINLIGGLILGVGRGMDIAKAGETFSVLSVGDALVSQIPALLVSAAAGIVVTRSASGEQLGRAFATQLLGKKQSVMMTAGILTLLAITPGMPAIPCLAIAVALFFAARRIKDPAKAIDPATGISKAIEPKRTTQEDIDAALSIDMLSLELGYELVGVVDPARNGTLLERVATLRKELAKDLGVVIPPVHVCDNLELAPGGYRLMLLGTEIGTGALKNGRLLAIDPSGRAPALEGEPTKDPTFGSPARWIATRDKEMGEALGYAVVDHATIIATHMGELLRVNAQRLVGRQEVQHLLDLLAKTTPKLVDDVVPALLSLGDVVRVLRNLVREGVSIRDMRTILESLAELSTQTKDVEQLTELVRERMSAHITSKLRQADGSIAALTLDPRLEETLRRSLRDIASGNGGPIDPQMLKNVTEGAQKALAKFTALGATPVVITPPDLRRYVRAIFERKVSQLSVVSFREVDPSVQLRVIETLQPNAAVPALADQGVRT
ncbi:MAG: flagellar biosynthesis protein FlhA, partial [Polyangiaceae bacterium]